MQFSTSKPSSRPCAPFLIGVQKFHDGPRRNLRGKREVGKKSARREPVFSHRESNFCNWVSVLCDRESVFERWESIFCRRKIAASRDCTTDLNLKWPACIAIPRRRPPFINRSLSCPKKYLPSLHVCAILATLMGLCQLSLFRHTQFALKNSGTRDKKRPPRKAAFS